MPNLNYGIDEQNIDSVDDAKEKIGVNDAKVDANDAKVGANSGQQKNKLIKKMIENPKITQNGLYVLKLEYMGST